MKVNDCFSKIIQYIFFSPEERTQTDSKQVENEKIMTVFIFWELSQ